MSTQNGKGDRPRNNWGAKWDAGFDAIEWTHSWRPKPASCLKCGATPTEENDVILYRENPLGETPAVWCCSGCLAAHLEKPTLGTLLGSEIRAKANRFSPEKRRRLLERAEKLIGPAAASSPARPEAEASLPLCPCPSPRCP